MSKYQQTLQTVQDHIRKHPGITLQDAIAACGISKSAYYYAQKTVQKKSTKPVVDYAKVDGKPKSTIPTQGPAPLLPTSGDGKLFMIVGTAQQIREMLK